MDTQKILMTNYSDKKVNVLMPMLGSGTRMNGFQDTCKPLMSLPDGNLFFLKALSSLEDYIIDTLCLVVLEDYVNEFNFLLEEIKDVSKARVVKIISSAPTKSPFESVSVGINEIPFKETANLPVFILDCDIYCRIPFINIDSCFAGTLFYFNDINPNKCFICTESNELGKEIVTEIREKEAISDKSVFGAYFFKNSDVINNIIHSGKTLSNVSDIFRSLIADGNLISATRIENVLNFGTEEEYKEIELFAKSPINNKQYKCLMFDFDGTLFDTFELNFKAYRLAYFDLGVVITREMFAKTNGLNVYQFNEVMGVKCDIEKLRYLKAKYYRELSVYARPNNYLLNTIRNSKIPCALVTTAREVNIELLMKKYDLKKYFSAIVTQEDVKEHKPSPEAYLLAQKILDVKAEDCLAFEDSRSGFVAARSAGADCVKISQFYDDCVKDMSGGSDATTKLFYNTDLNCLYVRKEASGYKAAKRLRNQYNFLHSNKQNSVLPECSIDKIFNSLEQFAYDMPYLISTSFYDYLNKESKFRDILQKIVDFSSRFQDSDYGDVRKRCYNTFIVPGVNIYNKVTGENRKYPFSCYSEIPYFVEDYICGCYHGDTTFENILIERNGNIKFIDPVPDGNIVQGRLHDFAKIGQSLYGYEKIRDNKDDDYEILKQIYSYYAEKYLTESERKSLKFHIACLFFRRLKHQVEQNIDLVKSYGEIAFKLIEEFKHSNYQIY